MGKKPQSKSAITASNADTSSQNFKDNKSTQKTAGHLLSTGFPANLDLLFNVWVVGAKSAVNMPISDVERQILAATEDLMKTRSISDLLPRMPAVIPRLLRSLSDDNVSVMSIAKDIAQDPTVVGEVIRIANSPYYRTEVQTSVLEQALSKLGSDGIRQVIATIAFRSIIDVRSGHYLSAGSPLLWKQTEKSAHAARFLAEREGVDSFDAYLAALVQNIGKIVQLKVIDNYLSLKNPPRSIEFYQTLNKLAYPLALHVVSSWDFPASVVSALKEQINHDKSDAVSPLGSVLSRANHLGMLLLLEEEKRIQVDPERFIAKTEGNHRDSCALCYKELVDLGNDSRLS